MDFHLAFDGRRQAVSSVTTVVVLLPRSWYAGNSGRGGLDDLCEMGRARRFLPLEPARGVRTNPSFCHASGRDR